MDVRRIARSPHALRPHILTSVALEDSVALSRRVPCSAIPADRVTRHPRRRLRPPPSTLDTLSEIEPTSLQWRTLALPLIGGLGGRHCWTAGLVLHWRPRRTDSLDSPVGRLGRRSLLTAWSAGLIGWPRWPASPFVGGLAGWPPWAATWPAS